LVYLENCPPRLISLFLTMIWNPKIYDLEWKKIIRHFGYCFMISDFVLEHLPPVLHINALYVVSTWKKTQ
jgi:hypothetical protein